MLTKGEDTDGNGPDWVLQEDFFSEDDLALMDYEVNELRKDHEKINITYDYNHFAGETMSEHVVCEGAFKQWMYFKLKEANFLPEGFIVAKMNAVTLYKPFDIHNDHIYRYFDEGYKPFMNFIIPTTNTSAQTVVFDQNSDEDFHHFQYHKEENEHVENPVDEEFWAEHCSHCRDEDRPYLTVKKLMPKQQRGMLTGIKSKFYHCSDSFHLREPEPKGFFHVRVGIPDLDVPSKRHPDRQYK